MIRARIRIAVSSFWLLGLSVVACHKTARPTAPPGRGNPDVSRVVKDTAVVAPVVKDKPGVAAIFKDTGSANVFAAEGRSFKLPAERESLRATLRKERGLWQAGKPRDYQFLLRVGCFCPGTRGWLLMEVQSGQPLRAWNRAGKSVSLTDWNTFTIDNLYDNLERSLDRNSEVRIAFDPRWHFPTHVSTVVLPGPDAWSIIEVRGFRPL